MTKHRVLAIGLDGCEETLARDLMRSGDMPNLAKLRDRSARYLLNHGPAERTGLAWEHVSTGMSPADAGRWAAVSFDPARYKVWQEGAATAPFPSRLQARTVVFDSPYFRLDKAPSTRGLVGWGAHDPGIPLSARPDNLLAEFEARFGPYPAEEWLYGFTWPSPERSRRMGESLAAAAALRAKAAQWLLTEHLPDWDLAMVVASEPHSATEGLWHGVDPSHPLHSLPSAPPAGEGLRNVYRAVDKLVGDLVAACPDAATVVFAMGGMGPNRSDVPSMALLPELLFRNAFGRPLLSSSSAAGLPLLPKDGDWNDAVSHLLPSRLPASLNKGLDTARRGLRKVAKLVDHRQSGPLRFSVDWMPATRYQAYWPRMAAFALPAYYDGRIRLNLAGRERDGIVPLDQYEATCDAIEALLLACIDPATGEGIVDYVERNQSDPLSINETESDLVVVWRGTAVALDHPKLGRIGPLPLRRPGGHTGPFGFAYVAAPGIERGDRGRRSSFDVVPTLVDLLGEALPAGLSGASLLVETAAESALVSDRQSS